MSFAIEIVETIRNIKLKIEIARKWNPFYDFLSNFWKINSSGGIIISSIWINFQFIFAYTPNPRLENWFYNLGVVEGP